uniref:Nsp1_C domain-containing protein n=1 Tax=Parastrongyloides trichosuri TaxID=131310 RepID=A0A0N4ZGD1_PARTI
MFHKSKTHNHHILTKSKLIKRQHDYSFLKDKSPVRKLFEKLTLENKDTNKNAFTCEIPTRKTLLETPKRKALLETPKDRQHMEYNQLAICYKEEIDLLKEKSPDQTVHREDIVKLNHDSPVDEVRKAYGLSVRLKYHCDMEYGFDVRKYNNISMKSLQNYVEAMHTFFTTTNPELKIIKEPEDRYLITVVLEDRFEYLNIYQVQVQCTFVDKITSEYYQQRKRLLRTNLTIRINKPKNECVLVEIYLDVGMSSTNNPSFTFGGSSNQDKPSFSFNAPTSTPNTAAPAFSFGNTSTASATGTSNLFCSTQGSKPSGNLFGTSTQNSTEPSKFSFGSNTTSSNDTTKPSNLFGSTTSAPQAQSGNLFGGKTSTTGSAFGTSNTQSGNIFGSTLNTESSTGNNLFGSTPSAPTPTQTGNLFGSAATTTTSTGGLFGSSQTATTTAPSSNLFGSASTNTAPLTTGGLFETTQGTSNSGNTFGSLTSTTSAPSNNLFGTSTTNTPSGNLFGNTTTSVASSTGGLFGTTKPATTSASTGLFGNTSAPISGGLFGTSAAPSSTTSSGLFGTTTLTTTQSSTTGGLFGSSTPTKPVVASASASLFGSATTTTQPVASSSGGLFSSTVPTITTTASSTLPTFGQASTTVPTGSSLFGSTPQTTTGGLFGSTTVTSSAPSTTMAPPTGSLFGSAPTTTVSSGGLFGTSTTTTSASSTSVAPTGLTNSVAPSTPKGGALFGSAATLATPSVSKPNDTNLFKTPASNAVTATTQSPHVGGISFGDPKASSTPHLNKLTGTTTGLSTTTQTDASKATVDITKPMIYKKFEQHLDRLTIDFMAQEKAFLNNALELNAYDTVLKQNQNNIINVSNELTNLEKDKDVLKYEVELLGQQQRDLDSIVTEMEKSVGLGDWTQNEPIGFKPGTSLSYCDISRQKIFQLQLNVDVQLKQADDDINEVMDQVYQLMNLIEPSTSPSKISEDNKKGDVVKDIQQVLVNQIDKIHWVEEQTESLIEKMNKIHETLGY